MTHEEKTVERRRSMRCINCNNVTIHKLRYRQTSYFPDDEEYAPGETEEGPQWHKRREYRVWVCAGCEEARFEIYSQLFGVQPEPIEDSDIYPKYNSGQLRTKSFHEIDEKLKTIYEEVIGSYNAGLKITCAMGIRALMEAICVNKGIIEDIDKKYRSLEVKLNTLCEQKHVPSNIINALLGLKCMGDGAAHHFDIPTQIELQFAIELVELLLHFMYEMVAEITAKARASAHFRREEVAELLQKRQSKSKSTDVQQLTDQS